MQNESINMRKSIEHTARVNFEPVAENKRQTVVKVGSIIILRAQDVALEEIGLHKRK